MKPRYRITPKAQNDLRIIGRYTLEKWGRAQRNAYLMRLKVRIEWLAQQPLLGKARPDVQDGFYSFPEGEHVLFYKIVGDRIDIIGIPHNRMDPARNLE